MPEVPAGVKAFFTYRAIRVMKTAEPDLEANTATIEKYLQIISKNQERNGGGDVAYFNLCMQAWRENEESIAKQKGEAAV